MKFEFNFFHSIALSTLLFPIFASVASGEAQSTQNTEPIAIDSSCGPEFLDQLVNQNGCFNLGFSSDCTSLGIKGLVGGAVGAGAGTIIASNFLGSFLKTQGAEYKSRFLKLATATINTGSYLSEAGDVIHEVKRSKGNGQEVVQKELDKLIRAEPDEYKKRILRLQTDYMNNPNGIFEPDRNGLSPLHKVKLEFFMSLLPEETGKLKKLMDARQAAFHANGKALKNYSDKNFLENFAENADATRRLYDQADDNIKKHIEQSNDVRLRAYIDAYDARLDTVAQNVPVFEKAAQEKSKRAYDKFRAKTQIVGGIVGAVVMDFGVEILGNALDKSKLKKCQSQLGLSSSELEYLSNGSIFSNTKIRSKIGNLGTCEDLAFSPIELKDKLHDAYKHFGGIPKGLCKILHQQYKQTDKNLEISKINYVSCDRTSMPNMQVRGHGFFPSFKYQNDHGGEIVGTWDSTINWFNESSLSVVVNGKKEQFDTEKVLDEFKCNPTLVDGHFDKRSCAVKQIIGCESSIKNSTCQFVMRAAIFRAINSVRIRYCDLSQSNKVPDANSNKSLHGPSSGVR